MRVKKTKQHYGLLAVLFLILLCIVVFIVVEDRKTDKQNPEVSALKFELCSKDSFLSDNAQGATYNISDASKLTALRDTIMGIENYKRDSTCTYILTIHYIDSGKPAEARASYEDVKATDSDPYKTYSLYAKQDAITMENLNNMIGFLEGQSERNKKNGVTFEGES